MRYGSSALVVFYQIFSTSFSYSRLGRIEDVTGLAAAVGAVKVTVTFESQKKNQQWERKIVRLLVQHVTTIENVAINF